MFICFIILCGMGYDYKAMTGRLVQERKNIEMFHTYEMYRFSNVFPGLIQSIISGYGSEKLKMHSKEIHASLAGDTIDSLRFDEEKRSLWRMFVVTQGLETTCDWITLTHAYEKNNESTASDIFDFVTRLEDYVL